MKKRKGKPAQFELKVLPQVLLLEMVEKEKGYEKTVTLCFYWWS